jgi:outer membrane protein insertion porin family
LTFITTPPYGLFEIRKPNVSLIERLRFKDFGEVRFEGNHYFKLFDGLVLMLAEKFGGSYTYSDYQVVNKYKMGGGFSNRIVAQGILRSNTIPLRGYQDDQFTCEKEKLYGTNGGKLFNLYNVELRYHLLDFSMFKLMLLTFVDAGAIWDNFETIDIKEFKTSVGVGVRVLAPMIGIIGLMWGYGFDNTTEDKWNFNFQIGT